MTDIAILLMQDVSYFTIQASFCIDSCQIFTKHTYAKSLYSSLAQFCFYQICTNSPIQLIVAVIYFSHRITASITMLRFKKRTFKIKALINYKENVAPHSLHKL